MEDRLPRKLAAILYADVAGYSRLTGEDEDATHRTLSEYLDLVSSTIESHGGRVMHFAGDAVLAKFDAVVDSMMSAVAIQGELNTRNADLPIERRVEFRIGVNLGDVIEDRGDIYGDGVNIAARLESLSKPSGICISESVRAAIGNKLALEFEFMGEQDVKNIAEPVRAYRVSYDSGTAPDQDATIQADLPSPVEQSIAVLPFDNLSGDPEQEYFADGLTEDITTGLSKTPDLFVISRNSTFVYKGKSVDSRQVGKELGVHYLLEGSVRKSGIRIRVTVQLIDTTRGSHVWAERYDRKLVDMFAVQDEIVENILGTLCGFGGKLAELARLRAMRKGSANMEAYDYFLRGREYQRLFDTPDVEFVKVREMFEKAIELDPDSPHAYLGLASYHMRMITRELYDSRPNPLNEVSELTRKALVLAGPSSTSHRALGFVCLHKRQFGQAKTHFERALKLNPNDANLLADVAEFSCYLGRAKEAIEISKKAMRLNPNYPDWYSWSLAFALFTARQHDEALQVLDKTLNPKSRRLLSVTYAQAGRLGQARAAAKEYLEVESNFSIKRWAELEPYEIHADFWHYVQGLRKAGLPE
jgi:TolB-like protein/Tfp pilus assembly protein PilF